MPDMRGADPNSDFHFVERDEPEKIVATLVKLVQEREFQNISVSTQYATCKSSAR